MHALQPENITHIKCCFWNWFAFRKTASQVHKHTFFLGFISPGLHNVYSFVLQGLTWTICFGIILLGNLMSVTQNNVFVVVQ